MAKGLKRRQREGGFAYYWLVPSKDARQGYAVATPLGPVTCVPLPKCLTEDEAHAEASLLWSDLVAWRKGQPDKPAPNTFAWLIDRYKADEFSPYTTKIGFASKRNYDQDMKIIRQDIGKVPLYERGRRQLTGEDAWRWHRKWGKPDSVTGKITTPSRARHVITMVRMLVKYAVIIGVPNAKAFLDTLSAMEFPTTPSRTIAPTRGQVLAIVSECLDRGLRSMAICTLAQFDFNERRISIAGKWEGPQWCPGWLWQNITPDWTVYYQQNKVGVVEREFDLKEIPFLLSMVQAARNGQDIGPVIVCEKTGLPWREKHYTDTFRKVKIAAGVPDEVWSMDLRAGGATEADGLKVTDRELQDSLGHRDPKTKERYRRNKQRNAQNVVKLRQKAQGQCET